MLLTVQQVEEKKQEMQKQEWDIKEKKRDLYKEQLNMMQRSQELNDRESHLDVKERQMYQCMSW